MRASMIVAMAVSGVLVGLAVVALKKQPSPDRGPAEAAPTPSGRQPAFHLDAAPEQRRAILEGAFSKVASARAERIGAIKDDIALLLDDPEAVRFIVTQWHQRRSEGIYADAAFADLFQLVKHAEFVEPTGELVASPLPETRIKGLQAAETQADPRLGPKILAAYRATASGNPEGATLVKLQALKSGRACKGDALPALLTEAFRDGSDDVAVEALTIASEDKVEGVEAAARDVLANPQSPRVRLHAAALLTRRGDLGARKAFLAALDPKDPGLASEALHLVSKHRFEEAADALRAMRGSTQGELRELVVLAQLRLRDPAVWEEVLQAADASGGDREIQALQLLAASGNVDATPVLLHGLARGGDLRMRAVAAGISASREAGFLPVVEKLVEMPVRDAAELYDAPSVAGPPLVPKLAALLAQATEPAAQARFLAWLAMAGGPEARAVMLRERNRIRRLVDERIRLVDLDARRLGLPTPR